MRRIERCFVVLALAAVGPARLPAQQPKVAAPTNVAVTSNATALTVSWSNMANAGSYIVNRRFPPQEMGTAASSPHTGPLPGAGVYYEYQVVSVGKGKNNTAASGWVGYTVPNSTTPGVIVTEPRPTPGTITPVPAGPATLNAESTIPGQIKLTWSPVPNATAYRVMRASTAPQAEMKIAEGSAASFNDAPVDDRWTFTYKVYALLGSVVSTPSPAVDAKSIAVIHPTGLKYGVTLTPSPGKVNVKLSWNAVPNAVSYSITGADFAGQPVIVTTATSYTLSNVPAGHTYRVCVGAIYPFDIGSPETAPCIDIKLQ